jgi:hypothetical protein
MNIQTHFNEIQDDFQAKLIENWQNTEGVIINIVYRVKHGVL